MEQTILPINYQQLAINNMKVISFNINGLRAAIGKGLLEWLVKADADYVCLQEVKYDAPHTIGPLFGAIGYEHQYWYPAEKKGYSGVAILAKSPALRIYRGSSETTSDAEGRILRIDTETFSLVNVYVPSGTTGEMRQAFKMKWLAHFQAFVNSIRQQSQTPLVICGDFNIAHEEIDIHNPKANAKCSGFLPEERQWLSDFLAGGFVDAFRHTHPDLQQYSWWTYRAGARGKNLGWRIDYQFVSESLKDKITEVGQLTDVSFSDHCPVMLGLDLPVARLENRFDRAATSDNSVSVGVFD